MVLQCKYCDKKFYGSRKEAFGRMSKHIWKEHSEQHRKAIKRGQRKKKKVGNQLEEELQLADDLMLAVLLEMNERLERLEGTPTIHKDAIGMIIDRVKSEMAHVKKNEKPTKPIAKVLLGSAYDKLGGKYEQR